MAYKIILLTALWICLFSCSNTDQTATERIALEQQRKELELKEKEFDLKRKEDSLNNLNSKPSPSSLADNYEKVKNAVFLIYTSDNITTSQGSAFVINSWGDAVSNYHVFENASNAIAINSEGEKFQISKIYTYNKEKDYIIFRIGPSSSPFNSVNIATEAPRIGEPVFTVGNPMGLTQTLSQGVISSYRENNRKIQISLPITHGSSGGPLFNQKGEVIGITTSGMGEADLNFAMNISELPLDSYANTDMSTFTENDEISKTEQSLVKETVNGYFSCMLRQDYRSLRNYLADYLDRCYTYFGLSKDEVIQKDIEYKTQRGISSRNIVVDWSSFNIEKVGTTYNTSFNLRYSIYRPETNKPTEFNLQIFMQLNSNFKVTSIFENILTRY